MLFIALMLGPDLSILIIGENRIHASIIEDGLRAAGHGKVVVVTDVDEVERTVGDIAPDVVVVGLGNPSRDMLEHFFSLNRVLRKPVAMFVDRSDRVSIEAAMDAGISAYVIDGLKKERVKPVLDMAISRFNALAKLTRELEAARSALEDRKAIDQAKAILMHTRGIGEEEAYRLLRKTAMNQNRRMADLAQSLILAAGLMDP